MIFLASFLLQNCIKINILICFKYTIYNLVCTSGKDTFQLIVLDTNGKKVKVYWLLKWTKMQAILAKLWTLQLLETLECLTVGFNYTPASDLPVTMPLLLHMHVLLYTSRQRACLWSTEGATWGEEPPQKQASPLSPHPMTSRRCLWGFIYTTSKVQNLEATRCEPKFWSRCLKMWYSG